MAAKGLIIVTGCSGRVGMSVMKRLQGIYQIVGFDVMAPKKEVPGLDFYKVDLSSDTSVKDAMEAVRQKYGQTLTTVIHLAAYYSFSKSDPQKYTQITVEGTRRMLEGAQQFDCEQFLFSSTQLVHDPCLPGQSIDESSPMNAVWGYPESKVRTEKIIHDKRGHVPCVVLRIAGCYDDECHSIPISNQIQRIYENQLASYLYPGDITHGNPFLHLDDLAECIWICVEKRKELPSELTMIIGEDRTMSYGDMQRAITRLLTGKDGSIYFIPKWFAKLGAWMQNHTPFMEKSFIEPWMVDFADNHYQLDISRAKKHLGWQPRHYVADTLPKMIDLLKKDPLSWYKMNGLNAPWWLKRKVAKGSACGK